MRIKEKLDKPVDEIEVDDEMVVAAAKDLNEVLKVNPPLDLERPGEELQKDVEELFEGIIEGDKLSDDTWKILKALGWKSANQEQATNKKKDQSVKEKTKKETNAGEFAMAAADVQKSLAVNPPLDLNVGEEALKGELASLLPNIQEGDDLAVTTWATLKKLGWGKKNPVTTKKVVNAPGSPHKAPKAAKAVSMSGKKPKATVKEHSILSDALPGFSCRKGSSTEWFINTLKKKPATMSTIKKLAGNPTGGTYYSAWKQIMATGKGKLVDGLMTIKSE